MEDNTRHPIDELFRNKLNENQPVSDDSLWEEVEGLMDKRKKRKRFLILFFTLLLIGSGGTGYLLLNSKADKPVYTQSVQPVPATTQNSSNSEKTANNLAQINPVSPGNETVSTSSQAQSTNSVNIKNSTTSNAHLNTTSSINNASSVTSAANKHNLAVNSKKYKILSSNSIAASARKDNSANSASQNQASSAVETQSGSLNASGNNKVAEANANKDSEKNSLSEANNPDAGKLNDVPASAKVAGEDTAPKKHDFTQEVLEAKKMKRRANMKWFVEVDGAYMDNFHLIGAPASVTPYYDDIRGSDEKPLTTFNYMLKAGVVRKNLMFNTGLGITKVGERVQYTDHSYDSGKVTIHNDSLFAHNGPFVNTYLTIPAEVSFLIPLKGVRFQMGLGVAASVPVKWTSYYVNQQVDGVESPGSLNMVNNIVINLNFTLGLEVPFTRHWAAIGSFNFNRDVSDVFKSEYGVRQEYLSVGGYAGIRYTFTR